MQLIDVIVHIGKYPSIRTTNKIDRDKIENQIQTKRLFKDIEKKNKLKMKEKQKHNKLKSIIITKHSKIKQKKS